METNEEGNVHKKRDGKDEEQKEEMRQKENKGWKLQWCRPWLFTAVGTSLYVCVMPVSQL